MEDSFQLTADHDKITQDIISTSKSIISTLNEDMPKLINDVKIVVANATDNFNNDNMENMDATFAENMDIMRGQHTTANTIIAKTKDDSIEQLHVEINFLIANVSKEISASHSIKEVRDSFISDIIESGSKNFSAINDIIKSSRVTYDTYIANLNSINTTFLNATQTTHETMIKSLNDCRDGTLTDLASF